MILLPKGIPVKEKVNPARVNLPEAMEKLVENRFSGYLRFDSPRGTGIIIFEEGHLISALVQEQNADGRIIAYDAISSIFEMSIQGDALLNIYRLSSDVAIRIHALLHGEYIYRAQDLRQIEIGGLLKLIRNDRLTGCLRVYACQRVALIFFEEGHALGFLHEGSIELETTADLSTSVAAKPEARLDLLSTVTADGLRMADLMASADLRPMWEKARTRLLRVRRPGEEGQKILSAQELKARHERFVNLMRGIAERHVGSFGVTQVEKAVRKVSVLMPTAEIDQFFIDMAKTANLAVAPAKVKEMMDEMRRGVGALL
jgi:hypothetical protein